MSDWPQEFDQALREQCRFLDASTAIAPEDTLVELGVDSLQVVELIVALEDAFDLEIPERDLTPEAFRTAGTVWTMLAPLVGAPDCARTA